MNQSEVGNLTCDPLTLTIDLGCIREIQGVYLRNINNRGQKLSIQIPLRLEEMFLYINFNI